MMMRKKKVWLITGGSRGIGYSLFKECIHVGDYGVICSRDIKEIKNAISVVDRKKSRSLGILADVSNIKDCKELVKKTIKKFGRIDVLVNNAGIYGPIGEMDKNKIDEWKKTIDINLMGTVNCCQTVLPIMKKQKSGKIINLAGAGVGGNKPLSRFSAYYTSKMAIVGFTEVLADEVKESNIQVNCISPGGVNTYFTDYLIKEGKEKAGEEMFKQAIKQKETGGDSPMLAVKLVKFLVSSEAKHVTGKIISAKWDKVKDLKNKDLIKNNLYNLRRIDNFKFYEK